MSGHWQAALDLCRQAVPAYPATGLDVVAETTLGPPAA